MFKYEIHLHSNACSACGVSSSKDMVKAAKDNNYKGIVFTNHFYHGNTNINRHIPWEKFVEAYKNDYLIAKQYGKQYDIDVLFGIEEVYEPGKEALIYGIEPDVLSKNPDFRNMNIDEMYSFVHQNGGYIVSAHPFRDRAYIPDPDKEPDMRFFDAIEVNNYFNTKEDNNKAMLFAQNNNLKVVSGGDVHNKKDFGNSGIAFSHPVSTNHELVQALESGDYKLIIDKRIID